MRALWKGTISFGLVNIPVHLFSAISSHSLGFKMLHSKCNTPIKNLRWCSHCDVEVAWEDIVKGMPLENGSYFVLTQEKLEELKPEKTDLIQIAEFVAQEELSPIYIDAHYYLLPAKDTDKAFFLFFQALKDVKLVAIGRFVLREKEYVCAIEPYKKGLLLSTLNYAYEIKDLKKLEELTPPEKISTQELKLAKQLISNLTKKKFDISQFKDTYAQKLKAKIKEAIKGKKVVKPKKEKKPAKVRLKAPSLMDVLKASLEEKPAEKRAR